MNKNDAPLSQLGFCIYTWTMIAMMLLRLFNFPYARGKTAAPMRPRYHEVLRQPTLETPPCALWLMGLISHVETDCQEGNPSYTLYRHSSRISLYMLKRHDAPGEHDARKRPRRSPVYLFPVHQSRKTCGFRVRRGPAEYGTSRIIPLVLWKRGA